MAHVQRAGDIWRGYGNTETLLAPLWRKVAIVFPVTLPARFDVGGRKRLVHYVIQTLYVRPVFAGRSTIEPVEPNLGVIREVFEVQILPETLCEIPGELCLSLQVVLC